MELVINLHENRIPLFDPQSRAECGSTNGTMICGTHSEVDFALRELRQTPTPTVRAVIDQIGCSNRHFNQLFRDQVGLTPKLFCRVRRLRQVLYQIAGKSQVDWADLAFTCGYFDQAHLIHDFRSLAGCTPTEYLAQRGFLSLPCGFAQLRSIFYNPSACKLRHIIQRLFFRY